MIDSTK